MPGGEQVVDALQALVSHPGREPGGLAHRKPLRGHRASDVLAVADGLREHAAQPRLRQRCRVPLNVADVLHDRGGSGPYGLQRRHPNHQRALVTLKEAAGRDGEARGVRESEVLVETTRDDCPHVGVTVDEAREQRLSSSVVDLGPGIRLQNRVRRADRHDARAFDRERHVVQHLVGVHNGGIGEHNGGALRAQSGTCCRLGLEAVLLEEEGGGTGSGAGEKLTPAEVRASGGLRRRRRGRGVRFCHDAPAPGMPKSVP